jgi:hypothetical protein
MLGGETTPYAIIIRMSFRISIIIVILLGLLGVWGCFRAGIHSLQSSRRQASWPERRKQMAAGWRYFGLVFFLLVMIVVGTVFAFSGKITYPLFLSPPTASLERTATNVPPTHTLAPPTIAVPTDTPTPTVKSAQTSTSTPVLNQAFHPTDTLWSKPMFPTYTPSPTDTPWLKPLFPTYTPSPTDTPWSQPLFPTYTPSPSDTPWSQPLFPTYTPSLTDTLWPQPTPTSIK